MLSNIEKKCSCLFSIEILYWYSSWILKNKEIVGNKGILGKRKSLRLWGYVELEKFIFFFKYKRLVYDDIYNSVNKF